MDDPFSNIKKIKKTMFEACVEIPEAIFAEVEYIHGRRDFICLGATFNGEKTIYHPFSSEEKERNKW